MVAPQGNCTQPSLLRAERGNAMELKPTHAERPGKGVQAECAVTQRFRVAHHRNVWRDGQRLRQHALFWRQRRLELESDRSTA